MKRILILAATNNLIGITPNDVLNLSKNYEINIVNNNLFSNDEYINNGAKIINEYDMKNFDYVVKLDELTNNEIKLLANTKIILITKGNFVNNPNYLFTLLKNKITTLSIELLFEKFKKNIAPIKTKFALNTSSFYLTNYKSKNLNYYENLLPIKEDITYLLLNYSFNNVAIAKELLKNNINVIFLENIKELQDDLKKIFKNEQKIKIQHADFDNILKEAKNANVFIVSSSNTGLRNKLRLTYDMIKNIKKNGIYIDLDCEYGFSSEITPKPNDNKNIFMLFETIMCIANDNVLSLFPKESSEICSSIITDIFNEIKNINDKKSLFSNKIIEKCLVCVEDKMVNPLVAKSLNIICEK